MARGDRQFARVDVTDAIKGFQNVGRAVEQANEELQIELARAGRDKMKEFIETRGTGETWTRRRRAKGLQGRLRRGSYPGRVNTGNMRDSVTVRFEGQGSRKAAAFGWIRNFEDYFGYQENGFYHVYAGRRVRGMFALRDARRHVVTSVLPKLIRKYERRIARAQR